MAIYFFLVFAGVLLSLTYRLPVTTFGPVSTKAKYQHTNFYLSFALLASALIGLRHNVGTDYRTYVEFFQRFARDGTADVEWVYAALNRLAAVIGTGPWLVFLMCALITNILVLRYLNAHSPYLWLSVVVLFGIGFFFRQTNQVRQMVAIGFTVHATTFIFEKKPFSFFLFVFLAAAFHLSAYVFLPLYWIARWNWTRPILLALLLVSLIAFLTPLGELLMGVFLNAVTPPAYRSYLDRVFTNPGFVGSGSRILVESLLVLAVFVLLPLRSTYTTRERVHLNLFFFGFVSQALFSRYWPVHRIPQYLLVYQAIVIPWLLRRHFALPDRWIAGMIMTVFYAFFAMYGIVTSSHGIIPYSSVLFQSRF